MLTKTRYW